MNEQDIKFEEAVHYLHGSIETELKFFAHARAFDAVELTTRVGALLSNTGKRSKSNLSGVPSKTKRGRQPVEQVEVDEQPHGNGTRAKTRSRAGKARYAKKMKSYWASMTKEERSKEIKRRMRLGKKKKEGK
jgi:hypothetical protein